MKQPSFWDSLPRRLLERSFSILIPLLAVLAAFVISGGLILMQGASPLVAYGALLTGAFGSLNALATTLTRLTPLVFTGLAVAYGYRGGFFNIGGEGQFYLGAMAAVWIGVTFTNWPFWLLMPASMAAAALAGALWALLPGYLKAARGFNEVLTTLLMNYIVIQFFEWSIRVDHPTGWTWQLWAWLGLKDPTQPMPKSAEIAAGAWLPSVQSLLKNPRISTFLLDKWAAYESAVKIPALKRFTLAPILALLAAFIVYVILFKTTTGFRARAVGVNQDAARYMGINVSRSIITTALISGALAGLGGAMEVLGSQHRVIPHFLVNAGFDGVSVALVGQLHPLGVLIGALFFGALRAGANKMQIVSGVPVAVVFVIQALAILFAIAGTAIEIRPRAEGKHSKPPPAQPMPQAKAEVSHG